jgi:hypothetical protein
MSQHLGKGLGQENEGHERGKIPWAQEDRGYFLGDMEGLSPLGKGKHVIKRAGEIGNTLGTFQNLA